jgi:hypothetical protein
MSIAFRCIACCFPYIIIIILIILLTNNSGNIGLIIILLIIIVAVYLTRIFSSFYAGTANIMAMAMTMTMMLLMSVVMMITTPLENVISSPIIKCNSFTHDYNNAGKCNSFTLYSCEKGLSVIGAALKL